MNTALGQLATELELGQPARTELRLAFALACAQRIEHLLEHPQAREGLQVLRDVVDGRAGRQALQLAARELAAVANRHRGSDSIDGSAHAAVSATYAAAHAVAGRVLEAASYAAYATVYAYGGYAVRDPEAFQPEFDWQVQALRQLAEAYPPPLVSAEWLHAHLHDRQVRVFDGTTHLLPAGGRGFDVRSGHGDYLAGHIPRAAFIDQPTRLCEPDSGLRFTLAQPERFARDAGELGLDPAAHLVLYSSGNWWWSTRLWWMLRTHGWQRVSVLDGGLHRWKALGLPLEAGEWRHAPCEVAPRPPRAMVADTAMVRASLDDPGTTLVNALAAGQFRGTAALHYGRRGRIPGSRNVPAASLVDPATHLVLGPEDLQRRFAGAGVAAEQPVIAYCGAGIAASAVCFALHLLGHGDVRLYDDSLQAWAADPALPMAC